jgi:inorganic triphosphatase YgiF
VPAKLELKSKAERGYDLIEHKPIQAVCAEKIKLRRGTSTADAFRIIARSTLRRITANEAAVQRSDSEGVHQMRNVGAGSALRDVDLCTQGRDLFHNCHVDELIESYALRLGQLACLELRRWAS